MPSSSSFTRSRPARASVYPLFDSSRTSSSTAQGDIAVASTALWSILDNHDRYRAKEVDRPAGRLCVAVEWPEDRRLGAGKSRNLVIWVEREEPSAANGSSELALHIHTSLIPPFSNTPLSVMVHRHQPAELSLAILQPILLNNQDQAQAQAYHEAVSSDELDLSSLYSHSIPNGAHINGDVEPLRAAQILREAALLSIPLRTQSASRSFRILMLEPVQQGILTGSTRLIISDTPYQPSSAAGDIPDHLSSDSYDGKSHLSLTDFDPDAFLSSSLSLSLPPAQPDPLPDGSPFVGDVDLATSMSSSTSGSITPRPGAITHRVASPPVQPEDVIQPDDDMAGQGVRFTAVRAAGPSSDKYDEDVCWLGVGGLGRAGIFEGDWVILRSTSDSSGSSSSGRLVKALAWERLDEPNDEMPANPILLPPSLCRSLVKGTSDQIHVQPTPFGARSPTIPVARTISLARIATAEGVDKRYERTWLKGLKAYFSGSQAQDSDSVRKDGARLVRTGDIISVPVHADRPLEPDESLESDESDDDSDQAVFQFSRSKRQHALPSAVVYFTVTSLSYDPLVPIEEDFRSSISSKARAGELGCWVDTRQGGETKMVLAGVEKARVEKREGERTWHRLDDIPTPYAVAAASKLRDVLGSCFHTSSLAYAAQLSILVKGAAGAGKRSLIRSLADQQGLSVVDLECYDVAGDSAVTSGSLLARLEKAKACAPSLLVLHHIEALAKKTESTVLGRSPPIVNTLADVLAGARDASAASGWPTIVIGTTVDADAIPNEVLACFKQEIVLGAPNETERGLILQQAMGKLTLAPDVELSAIARQTAALNAGDIAALLHRAFDLALLRATEPSDASRSLSIDAARLAGLTITSHDINKALDEARSAYSDSIGAPKIPNVSWDDVGSLGSVKRDILDTIQLPLDHPEMFGDGLKKRSGILLYGPPGTGKTLLAKAVATSCSLNFLSVKGPELLNMYIGESEANVRRIFQKARDAAPCVIFMDELDSVAPKRGNQGDSGGVMDRIVSQLLAELDGMSSSTSGGGGVFVMGATNRPDLLDPALLRPGRFDKLLYLSLPTTHEAQFSILQALTRKFKLDPELDLQEVADMCPFNYTGADLYALCADAMLGAMMRLASNVDKKIEQLNAEDESEHGQTNGYELNGSHTNGDVEGHDAHDSQNQRPSKMWRGKLTSQYYLSKLASPAEVEVRVTQEDFVTALERLVPSVSEDELRHYESVQQQFKGMSIGSTERGEDGYVVENGGGHAMMSGKGKGKARAEEVEGDE